MRSLLLANAAGLVVVGLALLLAVPWLNPGTYRRVTAALLDLAVALAAYVATIAAARVSALAGEIPAGLAGTLYLLLRDTPRAISGGGRGSLSKQLLGLHIVTGRGSTPWAEQTLLRNLPLVVIAVLSWWPARWSRLVYPALALVELLLTVLTPSGRRIGDLLARTRVEEA